MKNYKETFMRETYKDSWMYYKQTLEKITKMCGIGWL